MHQILVTDDDIVYLEAVQDVLKGNGYTVDIASTGEEAIAKVEAGRFQYSLILLDYQMKGMDGATTTRALRRLNPDLFIVILSGDDSRQTLKAAYEAGINWFIEKSSDKDTLLRTVKEWCNKYEETHLTVSLLDTQNENQRKIASVGLVGRSQALAQVAESIASIRSRKGNVLLLGETGTGKEEVAKALHHKQGNFIAVNCGAHRQSPWLLESRLFGHRRGAFTGADRDKKGVIEEADGGTVFLDEIHLMNMDLQASLLRAIQERVVCRMGETRELPVKFRLICAGKPDIEKEIERGNFREDLYYRIKGTLIHIPPLRERKDDIEPLVAHFARLWSKENGTEKTFLLRTVHHLKRYNWPGNVRELKNLVDDLFDRLPKLKITPEDLDPKFFCEEQNTGPDGALNTILENVERDHIAKVFAESKSIRDAAKRLELSPAALFRRLKKFKIDTNRSLGGGSK